ncbi:MAG: CHAT domain-containing tetratricopeptide repeat protein, partial [Pseudomonadota bacterium]
EDVARTLHSLAMRYEAADQLEAAIDSEARALALYRSILPDTIRMATSAHALGRLYWSAGQVALASPLLEEALFIARRDGPFSRLHAEAAFAMGEVFRDSEEGSRALSHYQEAVAVVESLQSRLGGSDEALARFRDDYALFFKRLIQTLLDLGQIDAAFEVSERYRAQGFLALLDSRSAGLAQRLPADLQHRYRSAQRALETALTLAGDATEEAVSTRVEAARIQLSDVADEVAASHRAGRVLSPRALSAQAVSSQLPVGTRLISFLQIDDRLQVFELQANQSLQTRRVELNDRQLAEQLSRVRVLMAAPAAGQRSRAALMALLDELGRELLGISTNLAGVDHLVIIPDLQLWLFPFAAARVEERYLVERFSLELSWSATSYLESSDTVLPGERLLALANPSVQLPLGRLPSGRDEPSPAIRRIRTVGGDLPGSQREAESIARLFDEPRLHLAEAASESRLRADAGDADVVHIAAHAYTNETPALEAYIQLAADDQHDGRLMVWEVLSNLDLNADLVTLSACATAMGKASKSEGLTGLTRAFGVAGARQVLASLWPIADGATVPLMQAFYQSRAAGLSNARALNQAQRELIDGQHHAFGWWGRQQRRWRGEPIPDLSHPFYWSGFSLYGRR